MPSARARISVSAVEGAVVSNPIAKNITCRSGLLRASFSASGRIDDADVHAARLVLERAAVRARHPHHVAERGEDHVRIPAAVASPSSIRPIGSTQTGQPGPWISSMFGGQHVLEAEAVDGVGVAAAHLHDPVVAVRVRQPADLLAGPA